MPAGVYLCPSIYLPVYLSIYQSFCLSLHTRISVELSLHIFIFVCSCSQQFSNFLLSTHFFSSVLLFLCAASAFLHYPLFPSSFALLSCLHSHSLACSPSLPLSLSLSLSVPLSVCYSPGSVDGTIRVWRQESTNNLPSSATQSSLSCLSIPFSLAPSPVRGVVRDGTVDSFREETLDPETPLSSSQKEPDHPNGKQLWRCEQTVESDGPVVSI